MRVHNIERRYPVESFPTIARNAIRELGRNVQAQDDVVALSFLSAMATVGQARVKVGLPIGGQPKPISLFILVVAGSGDRKTTVDNLVLRSLREYDNQQQENFERAKLRYRSEHRIWVAQERRLIRQAMEEIDDNDSLRDAIDTHYENEPIKPRLRRQMQQNSSERAVTDALAGSGESFALIADEGGVILRSPLFCNGALLNKLWDGGPIILDRAHGVSLAAKDIRVTTSIMVQPHVLQDFVRDKGETLRGSGFFARFLISRAPSLQGFRFVLNADNSWPELEKFHQAITNFLNQENLCNRVIELDEDAKQVWIEFVNQVEMDIRPGGYLSEINDFASKVGEIVARIAAVFHFFDNQDGCISTDTVRRAIEVVCYHIDEFKNIFDPSMQVPQGLLDARKLHSYLHRHFWVNQINSIPKNHVLREGPVRVKNRFDPALGIMQARGLVWVSIDKSKRHYINLLPHFSSWCS